MKSIHSIPRHAPRHSMAGFSLVELMVASAISLFLLGGVIAIFASSRSSYETTERLSRIQETGRYALDQIVTDIRSSGFPGCARVPTYIGSALRSSTDLQWNFLDGPIRGYQYTGTGFSPVIDTATNTPGIANGSDILVVRRPKRDSLPLRLQDDMGASTNFITVPNVTTSGLAAGDIALIYSCEALTYFQVSTFSGGVITHAGGGSAVPGNIDNEVNYAFRENAEVLPVETVVYWIAPTSDGADDVAATSLWRRIGVNAAEELVVGVEQMQLRFGVDTNGDMVVDGPYVLADAVTDWGSVYSVEVGLLVRSPDAYGTDLDVETYQVLDVPVPAPNDRLMREVFTTSVGVRNRVPTS